MAKKNVLGKGLDALIESVDKDALVKKVEVNKDIPIDAIEANPFQPRTVFDEQALSELSASIKNIGIVQPLTVRELGNGKYQLIAGERRLRAAKLAGLETVPAFIRTVDDDHMIEFALVENIQRENLDAIEVAISFQRLIEECNLTQEQLSDRVAKQRSTVANYLRLLKLPAEIQHGIRNKIITMGHARALVSIEDEKQQMDVYYKIKDEELSVRQTEELVRKLKAPKADPRKKEKREKLNDYYKPFKDHINKIFHISGSDVQFVEEGKGKIVIPFNNFDELENIARIFDLL